MALSKTIPLKNLVFTEKPLTKLVELFSQDYQKDSDKRNYQRYTLDVAEDSETLITVDRPPQSASSFFENPIHRINLRFTTSNPEKRIEFKLVNGSDYDSQNYVEISGEDDEWVHSLHRNTLRIVDSIERQPSFFRHFNVVVGVILVMLLTFVIFRICDLLANWIWPSGLSKISSTTGMILGFLLVIIPLIAGICGFTIADFLKNAYPSIEIKTGASKFRVAERRRKFIKPMIGFLVVTPVLTYVGDLWQWLIIGK